jgi:hypothetical protein
LKGVEMRIIIDDPQKGRIQYDMTDSLDLKTFVNKAKQIDQSFSLEKACDIIEKKQKASGYGYSIVDPSTWKHHRGFAYLLVANGRIAKIGMTEVTLSSRFSSYTAGTRKARDKGTCSVTNFYCSEFIRYCLRNNIKVEVYAYRVPPQSATVKVLGESTKVPAKTAYFYETAFLNHHVKVSRDNCVPVLCRNASTVS